MAICKAAQALYLRIFFVRPERVSKNEILEFVPKQMKKEVMDIKVLGL